MQEPNPRQNRKLIEDDSSDSEIADLLNSEPGIGNPRNQTSSGSQITDPLKPLPIRRPARWPDPTMNFLVAYDICDPKRLRQVAKCLEQSARRVQKSVFMFTGSRRELDGVLSDLIQYIDTSCDRIQAWPIRTSTRSCRVDVGEAMPDTGLALVFTTQEWTMIEARDDDHDDSPWLMP